MVAAWALTFWTGQVWMAGALAAEPEPPKIPSLSTQIKHGLVAGVREKGGVKILAVRMFPNVIAMSEAEIEAHLASDEPLSVGIIETSEHGRLRMSCHHDTCTAISGTATIELTLLREAPAEPAPKRRGAPTGARR